LEEIEEARTTFKQLSAEEVQQLTDNIIAGLPGRMTASYKLDDFRKMLANYQNMTSDTLRKNLVKFSPKQGQ